MRSRLQLLCAFSLIASGPALANTDGSYADYAGASSYEAYPSAQGGYSYNPAVNDNSYDPVEYDLSGTGGTNDGFYKYLPSQSIFEYLGPMKARNGEGHATLTNWHTRLGLADATSGSWRFSLDGTVRLTWFDGDKDAAMDVDRLYTIWLNLSASYKMWGSTYLTFGVNPEFSSDFDSWVARNFSLGGHLLLSSKLNERFKFTVGAGIAPQLGSTPVFPYVGFSWQASPTWLVEMQGTRLSAMNKVTDYFSWGPFVSVVAGSWVVKHNHGHARYQWVSGVAGLATETGLGQWGKVKPKLLLDAGFSFANNAKFKTTNGRHELEEQRFDPGFYLRAGLRFAF